MLTNSTQWLDLPSAERAGSSISRFYDKCKKGIAGKKGYPPFQKDCDSVEYKSTGWKLVADWESINFTDKKGVGRLKLKGTRDLHFYQISQIKRVRLVKRNVLMVCTFNSGWISIEKKVQSFLATLLD